MHADHPKPDDLSDLERRLATWQPTAQGLDTDRMLYAAGRASVRPSRARCRYWQGVSFILTAALIVLGVEFSRARLELHAIWANRSLSVPSSTAETTIPSEPPQVASAEPLPAASLFAARRALDAGIDAWRSPEVPTAADTASPAQPILQVWQADRLLER